MGGCDGALYLTVHSPSPLLRLSCTLPLPSPPSLPPPSFFPLAGAGAQGERDRQRRIRESTVDAVAGGLASAYFQHLAAEHTQHTQRQQGTGTGAGAGAEAAVEASS